MATGCGTKASIRSSASIPASFDLTPANIQALFHPDDVQELHEAWASFARGSKSYEAEFRIIRPNGEVRWCAGTAAASTDKGGRVIRVSGVTVDITERKQAEERQNLLAREVDHRAKNALALAQSIVRLTRGENVKSYIRSVEGRINALARVHTVLSLSNWQGAEIRKLIDEELAPYSTGDQIELSGPEIQLEPATAQTVALALHELVTNSAKYGALSTLSGRLSVGWEDQAGLLKIIWVETGGPPVEKPVTRGFGTRSVIASIESQLGGRAEFDWRPEGLVCCLSVPLPHRQFAADPVSLLERRRRQRLATRRAVTWRLKAPGRPGQMNSELTPEDLSRRRCDGIGRLPAAIPCAASIARIKSGGRNGFCRQTTSESSGISDRKSSAVIPEIAMTGRPGARVRSAVIRSEPLVPCRKISTIARSKLAVSNSFNADAALSASTISK